MFENKYIQERINKAEKLREEGINPYPNYITSGTPSNQFRDECSYIHDLEDKIDESKEYRLVGRIKFIRKMGKASFAKIEDSDGLVQIYFNRDDLPEGYYNI